MQKLYVYWETLLPDASKEVGLEVNAEKTKYTFMFHHLNAAQNHKDSLDPLKMWQSSNIWEQE
jgi:hypothetical protein